LSAWLSRARISNYEVSLTEQAITDFLGMTDGTAVPVAALSYLQDFGEPPGGACMRADPVHLRADSSGLILFDATTFELNEDDSQALAQAVDAHLAAVGWHLRHGPCQRWYLLGDAGEPVLNTLALPKWRGAPVPATPFAGKEAVAWTARLNEIQMLLYNHPVNQARATRSEIIINSIWPWGEGTLTARVAPAGVQLSADNVCARGAVRWCGLAASEPLEDTAACLARLASGEPLLLLLESCRVAAAYGNFDHWQRAVACLEKHWFAPLLAALKAGRLDRLELWPLNGKRYRLERRQLRYFWRRIRDYRYEPGFFHPQARQV